MVIRPAVIDDAPSIARVRQVGWQMAYRGIIPDEVLDQMDIEKDTTRWRDTISSNLQERCLYCAEMAGHVVGFCGGGPVRDQDSEYEAEIYALYVLPETQRCGVGWALAHAVMDWLRDQRYHTMLIWVLRDNQPARRFYETLGGVLVRERLIEIGGADLVKVGYGYMLDPLFQ